MKKLYTFFVVSILLISSFSVKSQTTATVRQNLFARYADKLPTKENEFEKAFGASVGTEITLNLSNLTFTGTITSMVKRSDNLFTVIIRSASSDNSIFSISKRTHDDNTVSYSGRILNEKFADGYQVMKDSTGNYALNKFQTQSLIQDF
jgi:hypothetical protein